MFFFSRKKHETTPQYLNKSLRYQCLSACVRADRVGVWPAGPRVGLVASKRLTVCFFRFELIISCATSSSPWLLIYIIYLFLYVMFPYQAHQWAAKASIKKGPCSCVGPLSVCANQRLSYLMSAWWNCATGGPWAVKLCPASLSNWSACVDEVLQQFSANYRPHSAQHLLFSFVFNPNSGFLSFPSMSDFLLCFCFALQLSIDLWHPPPLLLCHFLFNPLPVFFLAKC